MCVLSPSSFSLFVFSDFPKQKRKVPEKARPQERENKTKKAAQIFLLFFTCMRVCTLRTSSRPIDWSLYQRGEKARIVKRDFIKTKKEKHPENKHQTRNEGGACCGCVVSCCFLFVLPPHGTGKGLARMAQGPCEKRDLSKHLSFQNIFSTGPSHQNAYF